MPRIKGYFKEVAQFYRWQALDHVMFGYVNGLRTGIPSMPVVEAIRMFLDEFSLCEDTYCLQTAQMAYYRIAKSLISIEMGLDGDTLEVIKKPNN